MFVKQFEDKNLAHFSYAIVSKGEMALIDPARNPQPYYGYANEVGAKITRTVKRCAGTWLAAYNYQPQTKKNDTST